MMYGFSSLISCCRLNPRVRRVMSRICPLNLSRAFGAMRRSLPSFEMLNPRNLRSSGRPPGPACSSKASRALSAVRLQMSETQDHVAVALPVPTHGRQTVEDGRLEPDKPFALRVQFGLVAHAAELERGGDRLEGGGRDGDADHSGIGASFASLS